MTKFHPNEEEVTQSLLQIDNFLVSQKQKQSLLLSDSASLLFLGMHRKSIEDISFYKVPFNTGPEKVLVEEINVSVSFPPKKDKTDITVSVPVKINPPLKTVYKEKDLEKIWSGQFLDVFGFSVGKMLSERLETPSIEGLADVKFLTDKFEDWEEKLNEHKNRLSQEEQQNINTSLIMVKKYFLSRPDNENPSIQFPNIIRQRNNNRFETTFNQDELPNFLKVHSYRKKVMYHLLPQKDKDIINTQLKTDKHKRTWLVLSSNEQHGSSARSRWVDGLGHVRQNAIDPNYFLKIVFQLDREAVCDFIDTYLNFEEGQYDYEKNTDPAVYSALNVGVENFKKRNYHKMDYEGLLDYLEDNPTCNPLKAQNTSFAGLPKWPKGTAS